MKIEALTRLQSVHIVPSDVAFSDKQGQAALDEFHLGEGSIKNVPTNTPGFRIQVNKQGIIFDIYLVHNDEPVGLLSIVPRDFPFGRLFVPSSFFLKPYRGMGFAKALYKWVLDNKMSILSHDVQSAASAQVWKALSKQYDLLAVNDKVTMLKSSGENALGLAEVDGVRLILLAKGVDPDAFIQKGFR